MDIDMELTDDEKLVLDIIKEYLRKNKSFNSGKFLSIINHRVKLSKININYEGTKRIIKSLIDKNILIEGSKLSKDRILLNYKRRKIFEYISKYPGTYYTQLVKQLNYSNHLVIWHLDILLKFNYVKRVKYLNQFIYYSFNHDLAFAKTHYVVSKEQSQKILIYLKEFREGVTKTKIASDLSIHNNTVTKYLNLLEVHKLIYTKKQSKKALYYVNEKNYSKFNV